MGGHYEGCQEGFMKGLAFRAPVFRFGFVLSAVRMTPKICKHEEINLLMLSHRDNTDPPELLPALTRGFLCRK